MISIAERVGVANGIKLLDSKVLFNWRENINWVTLDILSPTDCILGQIFGNYLNGLLALELEKSGQAVVFGFHPYEIGDILHLEHEWHSQSGKQNV